MWKICNRKILCFGEVLWDNLPAGKKPGGAPMNVALHLHNAGQFVTMVSKVGNDEAGIELLGFLEDSGISTKLIGVDDSLPTSQVLVHLDESNNATYEICEPVAWDNIRPTDSLVQEAGESGIIIFGSLAARNQETRKTLLSLLETGAVRVMDVNLRKPYDKQDTVSQLLKKSDIVKLNDDELGTIFSWYNRQLPDESSRMKWLADYFNLTMVCVTRGEKGACLLFEGEIFDHPGFKVETHDTVGAGDAFLSGLISSFIDGKSMEDALALACATGAYVASQEGATPEYDAEQINRILSADPRGRKS